MCSPRDYVTLRLTVKRSGSVEMNSDSLDQYDNPHVKLQVGSRLNKGLTALLEGPHKKFILLEDLVANIQHPSILDLKMGTRTYGDEESDAKKSRKERRAENSTSKTLGVRLHGMQKYNVVTGKYETIDKYDGLKYKVDEFQSALRSFLNDGLSVRQELITPITHTLRKFYDCVSQQDTFRFYSSSLLIIYDSDPDRANPNVNIRAIDFAHTTYKSSPNSSQHTYSGPDKGYLLGLETVIDIFNGCAND